MCNAVVGYEISGNVLTCVSKLAISQIMVGAAGVIEAWRAAVANRMTIIARRNLPKSRSKQMANAHRRENIAISVKQTFEKQ